MPCDQSLTVSTGAVSLPVVTNVSHLVPLTLDDDPTEGGGNTVEPDLGEPGKWQNAVKIAVETRENQQQENDWSLFISETFINSAQLLRDAHV